jgi:hypothetical protein
MPFRQELHLSAMNSTMGAYRRADTVLRRRGAGAGALDREVAFSVPTGNFVVRPGRRRCCCGG